MKLRFAWAAASVALAALPTLVSAQPQPPAQDNGRDDRGDARRPHDGDRGGQAPGYDRRGPDAANAQGGRGPDGNRWGPNAPGGQGGYAGRGGADGDRRGPDRDGGRGYGAGGPGGDRRGPDGFNGRDGYGARGPGDNRGGPDGVGHGGGYAARGPGGGGWDRSGWRSDRRYDWHGWRDQHRDLFRGPRYLPPRGFGGGYRSFGPGYRLQPFFYDRTYWLADPWNYRLPPANGPYRWVRYYNDVLLVDLRSGVVVDAVRNLFW